MPSVFILILHNLRSAHNVGAVFRTAEAAGIKKIFLTGYTPAPLDRFGRPNKEITKTALGAEQTIVWKAREDIFALLDELAAAGFQILALEQAKDAVDYRQVSPAAKTALILGNEVSGIAPEILARCDQIIQILMRGKKESLNVAVAAGVVLFRLLDI